MLHASNGAEQPQRAIPHGESHDVGRAEGMRGQPRQVGAPHQKMRPDQALSARSIDDALYSND
jgi:hypothetical protein